MELPISNPVQKLKRIFSKLVDGNLLIVAVSYDNQMGKVNNEFSITGEYYEGKYRKDSTLLECGCIHSTIEKFMPELAHSIKFHLMSSEQPIYYFSSTLSYSSDVSHKGKEVGEALSWCEFLELKHSKILFDMPKSIELSNHYKSGMELDKLQVFTVHLKDDSDYEHEPNYYVSDVDLQLGWHYCKFYNKFAAQRFCDLLKGGYSIVKIPETFCKAVEPDLEAARESAIWDNATLAQLQSKEALEAHLLDLRESFYLMVTSEPFNFRF